MGGWVKRIWLGEEERGRGRGEGMMGGCEEGGGLGGERKERSEERRGGKEGQY